jgi:hypothetical protein
MYASCRLLFEQVGVAGRSGGSGLGADEEPAVYYCEDDSGLGALGEDPKRVRPLSDDLGGGPGAAGRFGKDRTVASDAVQATKTWLPETAIVGSKRLGGTVRADSCRRYGAGQYGCGY